MTHEQIKEKINQRRRQMLVHSCIYYRFDTNIVSDFDYDRWVNELMLSTINSLFLSGYVNRSIPIHVVNTFIDL